MDGKVNTPRGQGLFNFFGEHALGSDFRQGYIGDLVAGRVNDFDFDFVSVFAELVSDVIGLPQRELGTT
jgi:hypothetical protein